MAYQRQKAIEKLATILPVEIKAERISDFYEENCFGTEKMKELLSKEDFKSIKDALSKGTKIDQITANAIAVTVKNWAMSKGVTHHAHWFQPLTGGVATKHDTFFDKYAGIEGFKGSTLTQQEPDGSSFPNGGIRGTHYARGYTGWDPTSPMFIYNSTLFVPTVMISYTGETLDYKAPLLKAQRTVDVAATKVAKLFDDDVEKVNSSLGCEQEYFLVDKAMYLARPDLVMGGRTVFGAPSPRGQQLDDHYFGSIPNRVLEFMKEFEKEALLMGIPLTTRHNEVAPGQFEVAPLFEDVNVGSDHNQLLMELMPKVADNHGLAVLFHEKPFAGLNGSGKHNNWSLITTSGRNLFEPSFKNSKDSLYTLAFLVNTVKAIYTNADIVRASIASAANDHRLGANEAPPAIISIFLGSTLDTILNEFEETGEIPVLKSDAKPEMGLGIERIPNLWKDNTDRNRTSPFAFTGNKFEFRAVGSTANCGLPMAVLCTTVAAQLEQFKAEVDAAIKAGDKKESAVARILRTYIKESKNIRFEGDGYSEDWVIEAEKRGLSNVKNSADALDFFLSQSSKDLFSSMGVLTERELEARVDVWREIYATKIGIEANTMAEIALNQILPAAIDFQNSLIENVGGLEDLEIDASASKTTLKEVSLLVNTVKSEVTAMKATIAGIHGNSEEEAKAFCHQVKNTHMEVIRTAVDTLEGLVDDELWPLPKYREMLFIK
jgi:glutamine synthetase